jgi:hypothetical protein
MMIGCADDIVRTDDRVCDDPASASKRASSTVTSELHREPRHRTSVGVSLAPLGTLNRTQSQQTGSVFRIHRLDSGLT